MSHLISIIVPVYNVEAFLERCIDSIINQTYKNLEIILVNDGSTDGSERICNAYAKRDARIITINQPNGGSSIARNTGLDQASGNIISFIDSDDYIEVSMYEQMMNLMIKHNLDVIEIAPNDMSKIRTFNNKFVIENNITTTKRIINNTCFSVWRRIYRKEVIDTMRFIPNIIHQDVFFTIDLLNKIDKLGYLDTPLYNYNNEGVSIIRSKYSAHKRDLAIRATEYISDHVPKHPSIENVVKNYIFHYYTDHYYLISRNIYLDKEKKYRKKFKKEILNAASFSNINLRSFLIMALPIQALEFISIFHQRFIAKTS